MYQHSKKEQHQRKKQKMVSQKPEVVYSSENGFPYSHHPYGSQYARPDGPILLQDIHLIESLAHFDRERIPERVVHAKGGGCRFEFELTDSLSDITFAAPYQKVGYKCPGTVRFSTVGGESGSPDTARDPRGVSWKMYTDWGVHDYVFNNTPVFFIRDANHFPHFIHTQKRYPQSHLGQGDDSSMFWDYLTQNPESIHQIVYMFGPRGTPASWADMASYSGHTFKFYNKEGDMTYVQIHILPENGFQCLSGAEAAQLGGSSPDYNQGKLYRQLERGEKPRYNCYVQTMTPKQAEEFRYSVNDLTKVWPKKQFPLRKYGTITLTENVDNYFEEIEQIAFSPSNTCIPGIGPSNDSVLQGRLFSYPDTQRHRLGANYQQLPVNRPRNVGCPFASMFSTNTKTPASECPHIASNFQRDGPGCLYNKGKEPNYISNLPSASMKFKNLTDDGLSDKFQGVTLQSEEASSIKKQQFDREQHERIVGNKINEYFIKSGISELDFEQPRVLYEKVFTDADRKEIISNLVGHASKIHVPEIKTRVTQYFGLVNKDFGKAIADGLGIKWEPVDLEGYAASVGRSSL
ncbi:catalase T [Zygosaccharomyces mellis]|uniref:Catalase n=1 Tax=Zygosaccharomyces mellis TaxID=42258 RepID=A0A4C2EAV5_9SACH|nr:catalase T [Zygosaccharomyces mellis]